MSTMVCEAMLNAPYEESLGCVISALKTGGFGVPTRMDIRQSDTLVRIVDPSSMLQAAGFADDTVVSKAGAEADASLKRVAKAPQC
jgi:hypothetical protein